MTDRERQTSSEGSPALERVGDYEWRVPVGTVPGMRVPGIVFGTEDLVAKAAEDRALFQVANVATLPGIVEASYAMPDIHWGYGFPIGGVAATDAEEGVVSPGGVGFDIACGVRLI
ncbi:MAG: RtcB family protein, partial [Actinobacteria bacterium]|nr:RtcB family protein [Actinomycetota bacterium]